ncbi:MAG: mismatch-specific DNA-glycosylase [Planctomycetes bacterium]|nr:mismatch-specific DNA-glycosylase [Planctomycetota bacterium]
MPRLRDVLVDRPRVLFVGINPGSRSGAVGHHFAGKGNPFWRLLHASGLTPVQLAPEEDQRLAEFGLALTNVCPRTTRTAAELTPAELKAGARTLKKKVARLRPQVVALVGLTIYPLLFGAPSGGAGLKEVDLAGARVFVLPNPSGLNASFPGFEHKLVWFRALRELLDEAGP